MYESKTPNTVSLNAPFTNIQRRRLLQTIHQIQTIPTINFDLFTNRSTLYDFETNKQIIIAVLKFIENTNKFN